MAKRTIKQESAEEKNARLHMMSFIDLVVSEIEEAGIKDEHATTEPRGGRSSPTTSFEMQTKRQRTA